MGTTRGRLLTACLALLLAGCAHAPPRLVQVFSQVNRVFDPSSQVWTSRLSVFVQASSSDGTKVFDRLHLTHEASRLYFTLTKDQWSAVEKPGEFWVGANDLAFPDGQVPAGTWSALLVTRAGLRVKTTFEVPPPALGAPAPRTAKVAVRPEAAGPGRYRVSGWVDDYMVWARDARGTVVSRTKTVGPSFQVTAGAQSFVLYSYDKTRGEGLTAGPFPVQDLAVSADR